MLIWLNGPFGGGKTQTAHELSHRLPTSVVCDPERAGFGLHRMLPRHLRTDFQDLKSWRDGVVEVLDLVLRKHNGPVIAPMTVINPTYFTETVGRLRDMDHEVHHFSLLARRETVLKRLRGRGLPLRRDTWAESKVDECLSRLQDPEFATHVWTDDLTIPEVADRIATGAAVTLTPNGDTRLQAYARRTWTTLKHIRFD
ncbi:MAG: AAA family ATPase [Actinomycetota bacterium]|nr:AAA family ATPase [Actinomycetota bacterium]